jgi:toxin-antitoxin system PIN domain toxin
MTHLLDVNALIAALWVPHQHHARFRTWAQTSPGDFATCALTELGYLRVMNTCYGTTIASAKQQLRALRASPSVIFWRDADSPVDLLPSWVTKHSQTSDGYLCALAKNHGAKLATFDTRIKDSAALLIP